MYDVTKLDDASCDKRVQAKPLYNIRLKFGLLVHFAFNNKKKTKIKISNKKIHGKDKTIDSKMIMRIIMVAMMIQ